MPVQPMPCVMVLRLEPNMDPYTKKTQLYQSSHPILTECMKLQSISLEGFR